jgi:hypothetical protein
MKGSSKGKVREEATNPQCHPIEQSAGARGVSRAMDRKHWVVSHLVSY